MKIGLEVLNEPAKGSDIEKNNNDDFATIMTEIRDNEDLFIDIVEETAICNESGSHDRSPQCPNCGTWKKHWEKITGKEWPSFCSNSECLNKATVGGHVVFANDKKGRRYIIPLCAQCNGKSSDEIITISAGTVMISANCSETCDKLKKRV